MQDLIETIEKMKGSTLQNYVIAGLDSSLLNKGCVRYFENSRDHQDAITPHSHRFGFTCLVLEGSVANHLWKQSYDYNVGDLFQVSCLLYSGDVGVHEVMPLDNARYFRRVSTTYNAGETYNMSADDIHSINFSKGAKVLFFEEPSCTNKSYIIEPIVNGEVIRTYENKDYMFKEKL